MSNELTPFELMSEPIDAHAEFLKLADIDDLTEKSNSLAVICEESAKNALSMALQSRKLEKALEESRVEITRPHLDFQRAVNKMAKDFKAKLDSIEQRLHEKINAWMQSQKDNPFTITDSLTVEDGIIYTKEAWKFDIDDSTKIPIEFFKIDHDAIEKAVKNGIRNIPGVSIYKVETTHLRIKNS